MYEYDSIRKEFRKSERGKGDEYDVQLFRALRIWQSVFGINCPISATRGDEKLVILYRVDADTHKMALSFKSPDDPDVRKTACGFRWDDTPAYRIPAGNVDIRPLLTRWLRWQTNGLPFYHRAFWGWTFKIVPIIAGDEKWGAIHGAHGDVYLCKGGRWILYKDADYSGPVFKCEKEFVDHSKLYGWRLQRLACWLLQLPKKG